MPTQHGCAKLKNHSPLRHCLRAATRSRLRQLPLHRRGQFSEQAEWNSNQKAITATRSGLVFDTKYREGEWVPAASPICQNAPPENVKKRFLRAANTHRLIIQGKAVSIRCDGCPAEVPATITTYISTEPEYTPPHHLQQREPAPSSSQDRSASRRRTRPSDFIRASRSRCACSERRLRNSSPGLAKMLSPP